MQTNTSHKTEECAGSGKNPFALRPDVETVTTCDREGTLHFFVKNPRSGNVIELGEEEYFICTQLDGQTPLSLIQSRFQQRFNYHLDIEQLNAFINQLNQSDILETTAAGKYFSITKALLDVFLNPSTEEWTRWNLFNPNLLVKKLAYHLRWCFTKAFLIFSLVIFLLAAGVLYHHFSAFLADIKFSLASLTVFHFLAFFFVFLNIPSEFIRGITAVHFGGRAGDFTLQLAFDINPLCYCKINMWEIKEKAGRNWVMISPTYCAVLAASLGVLCWKMAPHAILLHKFGLILATEGALMAVVRLNLMWPTDTAAILSNWLEIADLRHRAMAAAKDWLLFRPLSEPLTAREKKIFWIYGLLAGLISLVSVALILYFASIWLVHTLSAAGALIAALLLSAMYRKKVYQWLETIKTG